MYKINQLTAILGGLTCALAFPTNLTANLAERSFDCSSPVSGLSAADCDWMSTIGIEAQGVNDYSNNGGIWIGSDGANTFTFTASAGVDVNLIIWNNPSGDYASSFLTANQPQVSYSLADGAQVTISIANDVSGAWSGLYNQITTLTTGDGGGQIDNTWGEFTTGSYATVDVSREVNMGGNGMSITLDSGCVSNMDTCVFECNSGNICGDSGTYSLVNCAEGSQTGATYGTADGNPTGGCQGFNNGGGGNVVFTS